MAGVLLGIARHAFSKAPMEVVERVEVSADRGIHGDFRGAMRGKPYRRQVTLIEQGDWADAMAAVGHAIPWQERRANLLIDKVDLPHQPGAIVRVGDDVVLEITRECDPCERMEKVAAGLREALTSDWRGGACAKVLQGGWIAVGDQIRIEVA